MNWFDKHLNWTYVIFFIISIIVSAVIISKDQSLAYLAIASAASIIINLAAGGWVLWKKGQSLWFMVIAFLIPIIFLIIVLLASNRNELTEKKVAINDETYYKNRDKK
jgi:hypothetical protein